MCVCTVKNDVCTFHRYQLVKESQYMAAPGRKTNNFIQLAGLDGLTLGNRKLVPIF